jgi:pectate lyase
MTLRLPLAAPIIAAAGCLVAPIASAADYHVSLAGKDGNSGLSPQSAFRSLAAACRATPAGKNTIHVAPGEYEETESSILPPGVSLSGAGIGKTIFHWKAVRSLAGNPMKFDFSGFMIQMQDSSDASISGITINGSLPDDRRAHGGILAHEVKNVSIHNCEVKGLEFTGIWLSQATNSSIHHCRFEDCGHPNQQSCSGGLQVGDLTDCTIHHNHIREHRGAYGIKTWKTAWTNPTDWFALGQNKVKLTRVRFHDNDIKVRQQGGWGNGQPNMALELWNSEPADCGIHHNRITGCVSLVDGGRAPKTIRVHHNLFLLEPGYSYAIEAGHHNMEIDHNVFRNGFYPIASFGGPIENLRVHHNTFDGIENHGVCNLPGVIDFSFTHNTVVIKNDMHLLNLGGGDKSGPSRNVTITNNLFVKDGTPPCTASLVNSCGASTPDPKTLVLRDNAFWNWSPDGESPQVADPLLERAPGGDGLLYLPERSPVRAAGQGNLEPPADQLPTP